MAEFNFRLTETVTIAESNDTALPQEVLDTDRWILWKYDTRGGKQTKVPCKANGTPVSVNDEGNWMSMEEAYTTFQNTPHIDGVGWVFHESDDIVGIDLDDVRDTETGQLSREAAEIVEKVNSFTEISPSGTGLHIITRGSLSDDFKNKNEPVEMYEEGRFFTMTAEHVSGQPTEIRESDVQAIQEEFCGEAVQYLGEDVEIDYDESESDLTVDQVRDTMFSYDDSAKSLWNATSTHDESDGDFALACKLAFWSGGDLHLMMKCMENSRRNRNKFSRKCRSDGTSYLRHTCEKALRANTDRYSGRYK